MDWSLWEPWYLWIAGALNISTSMDYKAAEILNLILKSKVSSASLIEEETRGRPVIVVGAGPSIERSVDLVLKGLNAVVYAADGSCSKLLEVGVAPHVVVTDLDGNINDIYECWRRGSYVVIHAHGDNIPAVSEHAPKFNARIIGTTQVKPIGCLHNFGGFTDGDRAVFMALELGCKSIIMIGMDLSSKVGKYSKPWLKRDEEAWSTKRAKFTIARKLLSWASRLYSRRVIRVIVDGYDHGQPIDDVIDVNLREIKEQLSSLTC
ncbi:MAG: DUF115 domain-containing protein [Candidatus Nezhaarchaeota archaeon]|nr:DUF115 domain-containing protein [Candidatus Nezhaarchaeota archaeon]MCX8141230.1 DUF115 domain-containing protein [Candidatus Nezhaarchaeota archaeon]MDW8049496.1 DUF115 domain-containing protein [Nitrososphaerota archaeon]